MDTPPPPPVPLSAVPLKRFVRAVQGAPTTHRALEEERFGVASTTIIVAGPG